MTVLSVGTQRIQEELTCPPGGRCGAACPVAANHALHQRFSVNLDA
ncbi:hypothetical protein ABZX92_23560 [Lentzea sp. NPDC006480]